MVNLDDIVQVVAGSTPHLCPQHEHKDVLCWGKGWDYQLGTGTNADQSNRPVAATTVTEDIVQIATGGWHTCALTTEGKVLCWGATGMDGWGMASTQEIMEIVSHPCQCRQGRVGFDKYRANCCRNSFHLCPYSSGRSRVLGV